MARSMPRCRKVSRSNRSRSKAPWNCWPRRRRRAPRKEPRKDHGPARGKRDRNHEYRYEWRSQCRRKLVAQDTRGGGASGRFPSLLQSATHLRAYLGIGGDEPLHGPETVDPEEPSDDQTVRAPVSYTHLRAHETR